MGRRVASPDQLDLLAWEPPAPVARFEEHRVRAATIAVRVSLAVAAALKDADERGLSREEIARRMSLFLGAPISRVTLDGYASTAREDRVISVPRFAALLHATGDRRLLEILAEPMDWAVIERRHLPLIELAAVQQRREELKRHADALLRQARAEGGL